MVFVPRHLLCEERRVYGDKGHPANGAGCRQLEVRRLLLRASGCASLNRRPVVELRGSAYRTTLLGVCRDWVEESARDGLRRSAD